MYTFPLKFMLFTLECPVSPRTFWMKLKNNFNGILLIGLLFQEVAKKIAKHDFFLQKADTFSLFWYNNKVTSHPTVETAQEFGLRGVCTDASGNRQARLRPVPRQVPCVILRKARSSGGVTARPHPTCVFRRLSGTRSALRVWFHRPVTLRRTGSPKWRPRHFNFRRLTYAYCRGTWQAARREGT